MSVTVTPAMIKELRERTAAGLMDCKKALVETDGDQEKAIEYLAGTRAVRPYRWVWVLAVYVGTAVIPYPTGPLVASAFSRARARSSSALIAGSGVVRTISVRSASVVSRTQAAIPSVAIRSQSSSMASTSTHPPSTPSCAKRRSLQATPFRRPRRASQSSSPCRKNSGRAALLPRRQKPGPRPRRKRNRTQPKVERL